MKNGSWTEIKIADLFASMSTGDWGQTPTLNSSIPIIRSTNFQNNGFLDLTDVVYRAISKERLSSRTINKGDILFEKSGGGPMQPAGRIAFSETDFQGTASNFIEIGKVKSNYDNKFVFYLLHSLYLNGLVLKYQQQTTGIINFKIKEYFKEVVKVPSEKKEQAKIAEVLTTIDRAIAQTEALIAKHQRIKTGLMQDLLTRGIDEQGQLRDLSTHRFKSTPLGMIPEEWEVKKVVDLSTQVTDGDHLTPRRSDSGVYLVSARNILNDGLDLSNVDYVDEKEYARMIVRCHPEVGDVLISCSGSVGRVCLVPENLRLALVRSVALIKFKKTEYLPEFSKWVMQSHLVQVQIAQSQKQAAQPNLFQDPIKKLLIPVPNPDEQKRIAEKISSTDAVIKSEFGNLSKLNRLKTGLMQDLLSGRVPVKPLMEG